MKRRNIFLLILLISNLNEIGNKKDKFIFVENNKGNLIRKGISEGEIRKLNERKEEAQKSAAILTSSRLLQIKNEAVHLKTLRILSIGNSLSQDAQRWLYQIAKAAGYEDIIIANLFWMACSLSQHAKNAKEDTGQDQYEYQLNTDGEIQYKKGYNIKSSIESEDWDFITLQQVSGDSGKEETYNEDLIYLIDYIKQYAKNQNVKIVWYMTWAYQSDSSHPDFGKYNHNQMNMCNAIVNAVKIRSIQIKIYLLSSRLERQFKI